MKTKLFFIILLFVILFGCKEEKQIEIIPDYDNIYLPFNKLDEGPKLIEGNDRLLMDSLFKAYYTKYPSFDTMKNPPTMDYKLMIGDNGKIEKIFIGKNNDKDFNKMVMNAIENWKFKPGIKSGKNAKSQYSMILWLDKGPNINEGEFAVSAEQMPEPIGGLYSIQEKIRYPEIAKRAGIEGKVFVQAFIDENGSVAETKVVKGIGAGCDEAALNAIKQSKFAPGKIRGKPVKVQVTIPIVFKLQ